MRLTGGRMRIAFLGDGSLNHVRRWAGYFSERGHDVLLLSFENVDGCPFDAKRLKRNFPTKMLGYLSSLGAVRAALAGFRPDVLNALYVTGYGLVGALSGIRPLVVSALGSDLLVDYPSRIYHRLQVRYAIQKADLVMTDADNLSDLAVSAGASRNRILKIYMGVDETTFHPPEGTGKQEHGQRRTIISTRNLYPLYNIQILVKAAPAITDHIDARFVVCGDGPERNSLERMVEKLGLSGRFVFRGSLSAGQIADELRKASVYVSTSRSDSTSVSLLEAMACGVPPVVTDIPANREWLSDGENGLLFPAGDHDALAAAVARMIEDRELAGRARTVNTGIIRERGLWSENMARAERAFMALAEEYS